MSPSEIAASGGTPAAPFDPAHYWEARLRLHPGLNGVGYTRLGERYNAALYALRSEVFRRLLHEWHLGGRSLDVLDVGSGTGHYVREWLRAGAGTVTATDLTAIAIERLRHAFPGVPALRFDASSPTRPPELRQYDVVSAFDVLFHIVDDDAWKRALRNCHALCRPGGYFVVSDVLLRRQRQAVPHMVSRTLTEVHDALQEAGFVVVDRRPMFVVMNYPADAGRIARLAWSAMAAPSMVSEAYGGLLGRLLFPLERRLVRWCTESPTTEIVLCRRPTTAPHDAAHAA